MPTHTYAERMRVARNAQERADAAREAAHNILIDQITAGIVAREQRFDEAEIDDPAAFIWAVFDKLTGDLTTKEIQAAAADPSAWLSTMSIERPVVAETEPPAEKVPTKKADPSESVPTKNAPSTGTVPTKKAPTSGSQPTNKQSVPESKAVRRARRQAQREAEAKRRQQTSSAQSVASTASSNDVLDIGDDW